VRQGNPDPGAAPLRNRAGLGRNRRVSWQMELVAIGLPRQAVSRQITNRFPTEWGAKLYADDRAFVETGRRGAIGVLAALTLAGLPLKNLDAHWRVLRYLPLRRVHRRRRVGDDRPRLVKLARYHGPLFMSQDMSQGRQGRRERNNQRRK
jgi:hypothetical protein